MTRRSSPSLAKASIELPYIQVRGACEHNLKHVDIDIPKKKFVVITGVSGSGKSSLAFDTVFAEGQRRYIESLSAYARQFLGQMEKPKYETIRGLAPTIAIEQKAASKNPRSTVATITEIYDYLRVLYARAGIQYCHICGSKVGRGDPQSMVEQILRYEDGSKIMLLAPVAENRKGEFRDELAEWRKEGYARVRIDGVIRELNEVQSLAKHKKHTIAVVIDRLVVKSGAAAKKRLTDSVETALKLGKGRLIVHQEGKRDVAMSEERTCCGFAFPKLDPPLFSFNSPLGMCTECQGLGNKMDMDPDKLIVDPTLSIREGAVEIWQSFFVDGESKDGSWGRERVRAMEKQWGLDIDKPWNKLPKKMRDAILYGAKDPKQRELKLKWNSEKGQGSWTITDEGLVARLMRRYQQTESERQKERYAKYLSIQPCSSCKGARLKEEVLAVRFHDKSIREVTQLSIEAAHDWFHNLKLAGRDLTIAKEVIKEVRSRLGFLVNVGLGYLTMDRKGPTLSGGEAQRIRLASQIGSELTGVLYVLDEPSIGLHQRDNQKLLKTLCHLRDIGNTLLVVEHDQETMEASDWLIDMGPGAGTLGGKVIAEGTPAQVKRQKSSLTGKYLSGKAAIALPAARRAADFDKAITIQGASENNLQNVDCAFPLGVFTCVTGVSGAGKSTLINQILYPALARKLNHSTIEVGACKRVDGIDAIDRVINIDQRPIGRTPRSNPATYTKVFDLIRDFFALLPEAKERGYKKGRFSFNVKGGRCEQCQGDGSIKVEMHFLADVYVPCEACEGRRFNQATLEILYRGHSIADVLDLTVADARDLFKSHPKITKILDTLIDVGLGYIHLGQSATTMSGGEAQRIKLSRELAKRDTGKTLYILDEPTTGLHFQDIDRLLSVLQRLVDNGNTVIVIEHNLDVIKCADWIIDVGPEGGHNGGKIIAEGTPERVSKMKSSITGRYLKPLL